MSDGRGRLARVLRSPFSWVLVLALGLAAGYALGGRGDAPDPEADVRPAASRTDGPSFRSRVGTGPVGETGPDGTPAATGVDSPAAVRPGAARQQAGSARYTPTVAAAREVSPSVVSVTVLRRERRAAGGLFDFFVPFCASVRENSLL